MPALIIIGASTGGTRVLPDLLVRLPQLQACVLIIQHMPAFISANVARTLADTSKMPLRLAADGDELTAGQVLVLPGDQHGVLTQGNRVLRLTADPRVNFVRPSIDVTMLSVAPSPGQRLAGVILTGMGKDGAAGIRHLKGLGATTFAQNEDTCAVFRMPQKAIETGCVDHVMPPGAIAESLVAWARR